MTGAHTPTPWAISYGYDPAMTGKRDAYVAQANAESVGIKLCTPWVEDAWQGDAEAEANAEFIVRAANCHDDLVRALRWLREFWIPGSNHDTLEVEDALATADDVLARACPTPLPSGSIER